jgi:ATP-dependent Lon protease
VSRRIPLFPLPGVVLLPGTLLPLHIFEPRYRAMVADALEGDRTIGMAMLKPGRSEAGVLPEIHAVGGAGEIVESEELPDGRYNIILEGRFRYRVLQEALADPYRTARVEEMQSIPIQSPEEAARVTALATRLFASVAGQMELPPLPEEPVAPERLASEIAVRLRYSAEELQAILEIDHIANRFGNLIGRMLEWQRRIQFLAPFRPGELDVTRN